MNLRAWINYALIGIVVAACSPKNAKEPQLFYGECKVSVTAEPKDATILVDSVPVGHQQVKVEIPCGSKQILVDKEGFRPYYAYHDVSVEKPLDLKIKLEKQEKVTDYALSAELVEQVRTGKKLRNPFVPNEGGAKEKETAEEPEAPIPGMDAGPSSGGAAAGAGGAGGDMNSVDFWR